MRRMGLFRRSRFARLALATALLGPLAVGVAGRTPQPQSSSAQKPRPGAPAGRQPGSARRDKGETYYKFESQALRWTTRFADAVVTSERGPGGRIRTRVADLAGNEVAAMDVDVLEAKSRAIRFRANDARLAEAPVTGTVHATLDWGNQQAYGLWKDLHADRPPQLDWQTGVGRPSGAAKRDLERDAVEVRAEWPNAFTASVVRREGRRRQLFTHQEVRGHALVGRVVKDGIEIGGSGWFEEEQVFSWSLRGVTDGYLDAKRLEPIGGWPFTPDAAWVNVQNYAFYQLHTAMKAKGLAARHDGWLQKVANALVPALHANEPGCDGLHWLDYTVFRPCCENHDQCYSKYGCSSRSWWQWWSSWTCDFCNAYVVFCFGSTARYPYYPFPDIDF